MAADRLFTLAFLIILYWQVSCATHDVEFSMLEDCDKRNDASAHLYCINVKAKKSGTQWQVWHRYTDFSVLRDALGEKSIFNDAPFPSKFRLPCFGSGECQNQRTAARRHELKTWLQKVLDQTTREESWQKPVSDFFAEDSKTVERYVDAPKILVKQKHTEILEAWADTKALLAEKLKDFKGKMGFGAEDLENKMKDVDKTVKDLNDVMGSGSEEAITDFFKETDQKIEELFSEQAKAEDAFGEELFYECGEEDSQDCQLEYMNAVKSGGVKDFCVRCASEKSEEPLRHRCSTCCSKCGGHAYKCGAPDNDDNNCKRAFEKAEDNNDLASMCNRCAKESGDFLIRTRCSLCCSKCQGDDSAKAEL